jgi:hypothetical protein
MNAARPPSFRVIQDALRKTTEYLACELTAPTEAPPSWNEFEWAVARSAIAMQGIAVLLANRLRWRGPADWQTFLKEQRHHGRLRHERIGELLERIDSAARSAGVPVVALKGAALRSFDFYAPGERPMGDIDLLVAPAALGAVSTLLRSIGYVEAFTTARHAVFDPRDKLATVGYGEHVNNALKIEVHTLIAEALPVRVVDITADLTQACLPGINPYACDAALMRHLLLHAAGNMRAHALRQIQLHDIALLAARLRPADWDQLLRVSRPGETPWWMLPPLALTDRYYPRQIPQTVLAQLEPHCPRALRYAVQRQSLTIVSWSNLRIHAFPGIAWSHSALEALEFIKRRVLPSQRALRELEFAMVAMPQLEQVPWYNESHLRRIVRWVRSRPPRVQTMVSVTAALAESDAGFGQRARGR